jgi:Mn-dependent DtxR family transcriptional regulator
MSTPSQEDYLEAIWVLTDEKGYARVTDLADRLQISPASASKMVRRLHEVGLLTYERYRGFSFTPRGRKIGRLLYARHQILERFLTHLAIGSATDIHRIVEGIEHHFDVMRVDQIERLVVYIDNHPNWWAQFLDDGASVSRHPIGKST